jgi:hypothetical protein
MSDNTKISEREAAIRLKELAGLSRKQAETVVADQEAHDAALAKAEKPKAEPEKPKKDEAPKK